MFHHMVILTLEPLKPAIFSIMERYCDGVVYQFAFNGDDFEQSLKEVSQTSLLLSFGTGVIVKEADLKRFGGAYNIHPGSSVYPGMHPHHFASMDQAPTFGAVVHEMTAKVDQGTIIFEESLDVLPHAPWEAYLNLALDASFECIEKLLRTLFEEKKTPQPLGISWTRAPFTHKDFEQLNLSSLTVPKKVFG